MKKTILKRAAALLLAALAAAGLAACGKQPEPDTVSYTHLTLPTT